MNCVMLRNGSGRAQVYSRGYTQNYAKITYTLRKNTHINYAKLRKYIYANTHNFISSLCKYPFSLRRISGHYAMGNLLMSAPGINPPRI